MQHEATMTIGAAARYLGVSITTLRRWDADGRLTAHRTPSGRRRYSRAQLDQAVALPDQPTA